MGVATSKIDHQSRSGKPVFNHAFPSWPSSIICCCCLLAWDSRLFHYWPSTCTRGSVGTARPLVLDQGCSLDLLSFWGFKIFQSQQIQLSTLPAGTTGFLSLWDLLSQLNKPLFVIAYAFGSVSLKRPEKYTQPPKKISNKTVRNMNRLIHKRNAFCWIIPISTQIKEIGDGV